MSPGTVTAIAYLITEALLAGVEMSQLIAEIRSTGKVSAIQWDDIMEDLESALEDWNSVP